MKIGIYGGTFDPIHLAHLLLAETAREACQLDQVWFIPCTQSPLKLVSPRATNKQRLEMLRLAIAGYPCFVASDLELKRGGTSYTVDTLRAIAQLRPEAELSLILGADSLDDFPKWREPLEILSLAQIVAVNRGRAPASLQGVDQALGTEHMGRFEIISMPGIDISASEIRARAEQGRSIRFQTPRAVEQYVLQHKIYSATPAT